MTLSVNPPLKTKADRQAPRVPFLSFWSHQARSTLCGNTIVVFHLLHNISAHKRANNEHLVCLRCLRIVPENPVLLWVPLVPQDPLKGTNQTFIDAVRGFSSHLNDRISDGDANLNSSRSRQTSITLQTHFIHTVRLLTFL